MFIWGYKPGYDLRNCMVGGNMKMELECEGNIQLSSTPWRLTRCLVLMSVLYFVSERRHRNTSELMAAHSKKVNCCNGVIKNYKLCTPVRLVLQ